MFQAIPHWPSPFSSMRHMERNESSKCWTSFSVRLGSTTTLRAPADELQGSTLPPAAPQPIPCCGPTSCPAETFTVWVQGCLCGGPTSALRRRNTTCDIVQWIWQLWGCCASLWDSAAATSGRAEDGLLLVHAPHGYLFEVLPFFQCLYSKARENVTYSSQRVQL